MRFLRFAGRHPLALLGVSAVAFICWIWWDAFATRQPEPNFAEAPAPVDANELRRRLQLQPPDGPVELPAQDPTKGLGKVKPGMTRAEVEKLVGAPATADVSPATVTDGRVTYHALYEADLGPLPTVRPVFAPHRPPVVREPDPTRTLVTLEFDATKPGHPLLEIHYPDPLF
jgi:hypothetical protein